VATEKGLYKSVDDGSSWYLFPMIEDFETGERILTDKFYSVATQSSNGISHRLWAGTADGLATSDNNGFTWVVYRSFISTRQRTDRAVYAYPTPFSPERGTEIRFQYDLNNPGEVKIDIFNFAMEKVISIREYESNISSGNFDRSASWDGRDNNGRMVDNGVYFFRTELEGKVTWGKIVVIN
jgi:hypothetical protein